MKPNKSQEQQFSVQTVQKAVVDHLRGLILSGQLMPGQRLVQGELSDQLGVSRTPVREALHILAHEGLVTLSSYKGAAVAKFSGDELVELYSVRIALESYACMLAAECMTAGDLERLEAIMQEMGAAFRQEDFELLLESHHRFHACIYEGAGKPRLYDLILKHLEQSNVYQRMALSMGRGASDPIKEHIDLVETLRRREVEAAGSLMRSHLELTMTELLRLFQERHM